MDGLVKIATNGASTWVAEAEVQRYLKSGWHRVTDEESVTTDPNAADPNAADPNAADPNAADPNAAEKPKTTTGSRR